VMESDISEAGSLGVGSEVRAAAALLAAVRTGLRALPTELKFPTDPEAGEVRRWMGVLGDTVASDLELRRERPTVAIEEGADGARAVSVDGRRLFVTPSAAIEIHGAFEALCLRFGWQVGTRASGDVVGDLGEDTTLVFVAPQSVGRVRVAVVVDLVDLSGRGDIGEWPTPKARRITKDQLTRMMEVNDDVTLKGRVALSSTHRALVYVAPLSLSVGDPDAVVQRAIDDIRREAKQTGSRLKV
jgi:hypothetical protein